MGAAFWISAILAVFAIAMAITSRKAVYALLYLLVGLMALALNLYAMGNETAAFLLIIVYAGAIMVLFVFVVMLLNTTPSKRGVLSNAGLIRDFIGPLLLALVILGEFMFILATSPANDFVAGTISAKLLARALFKDGWYFVELISLILTAALIGAFHIGRRRQS